MRSLIIIEVEHGETTDGLDHMVGAMDVLTQIAYDCTGNDIQVLDYTIKIDIPDCFSLDS